MQAEVKAAIERLYDSAGWSNDSGDVTTVLAHIREQQRVIERQAATLRALTDLSAHYELTDGRSNQSDAMGALFEIFGAVTWAEGEFEKSAALAVGEQLQLECGVWIRRVQ
ncbi:MAG: hypothetical protein R3337_00280 [Gammaproteobacteria bacterium]|nr:hypothetical protein [Gammaproteobacteria bacterium]